MAANYSLDTGTVSLSDILSNSKVYRVPAFQRDYSWERDDWENLRADILTVYNEGRIHYMGSIVLQNNKDKKYLVIDGQQRLTTFTLPVLAIIKVIQNLIDKGIDTDNNKERVSLLSKKFLGDKDPASLTYSAKLELNENNNNFFQTHLMVFRPPLNERMLDDSNSRLWKGYHFFLEQAALHFQNNENGEGPANFLNKEVAEKMIFIQIIVQDELSAYTVFETLNSRGVNLTVTDLLKNYLFSLSTQTDLVYVKEKWRKITDSIGLDNFPAFLRHYWLSKNKTVRQEYLFRAVKEAVKTSPQVIELLDELEKNAQLYNALSHSADPFWIGQRELKRRIKEIELFQEKQALPLLSASYNSLPAEEFSKVLRVVSVITFRYTVIGGLPANLKEEVCNKTAIKISHRELTTASSVAKEMKSLYTADKDFKNDFSTIKISTKRNKKLVRYILFEIENHLAQTDIDYEDNPATIEHIFPENAGDDLFPGFPIRFRESLIYRLGNYTLLEDDKNKVCGTKNFEAKKVIYQSSQYAMTKQIASAAWTPDTLENRQLMLSRYATAVWRLPYFD